METNEIIEKFKEVKRILIKFDTKEAAVEYLINETKLSEDECRNAYDVIIKIPD